MNKKVRVRFAPSPTGPLHIGGVRTALFNYLFAKKHGGDFVLRIEDTDQGRYVPGAEDYIVAALNWCGIPFDEGIGKDKGYGPYRQSERKHLYKDYADELIAKGSAYYAFDTADELDALRKSYEAEGKTFIYNWHNRKELKNSLSLTEQEVQSRLESGADYVLRFKCDQGESLVLNDLIRGEITIDTGILDDKILFKSDGMPTYHLANIVDDHLMEITHVIRGEEWLPSLALHHLLYRAFGWDAPEFAHLPLILKPTGKGKLSKRDGDKLGFPVFPLQWTDPKTGEISRGYREDGYFSEAVINFLALLGWNPGTEQEVFSQNELIDAFLLERVNKSGARFDPEKIKWFNHHYLQLKDNAQIAEAFSELLAEKGITTTLPLEKIVGLVKERATFISDLWEQASFFFKSPDSYDAKAFKKQWKENTASLLNQLVKEVLESADDFSATLTETAVKQWIADNELGFGQIMPPLRLALVGAMRGPHIFDITELIGKEETILRIQKAITALG
ncbi:glutamate--tRNA ligase [Sinomicrobium sp.]